MAFELAPALFGLAGTLVGGGVTFAANWLTGRNQRVLAETSRQQAVLDRRYDAHLELLLMADRVGDTGRALVEAVSSNAPGDKIAEVRKALEEGFAAVSAGKGTAQLAGPEDLVPKLTAFMVELVAFYSLVQKFDRTGGTGVAPDEILRTLEKWDHSRREYVSEARKLLK